MSKFVHLHTHSHYSLLNATPKIPELVNRAKKYNMPALALTDNGNLYGAISFYKKCLEAGIKPIIGVDFYVSIRTRFDKQAGVDNRRSRLVLLAKNNAGYKNLIKLVTDSFLEGFYYKPRIDHELMRKFSDGLIAVVPSFSGEVAICLRNKDPKKAGELIRVYEKIYGRENLYLEITHHPGIFGHSDLQKKIIALSQKTGIPLVAAHDIFYMNPEDKTVRDTLLSVQSKGGFSDQGPSGEKEDFSFISPKAMLKKFEKNPEATENTIKIAEACNLKLDLGNWVFPKLGLPERSKTYDEELRKETYEGLKKRELKETPELKKRVEYELGVIKNKGYSPYFLVVSDLLSFAHRNNILTTIRGSVAGSMVTYLCGITNVNPLEYKLPFERFLNPERPSAPDIDMDFADNRRDEVIQYAKDKYGEDKVVQIGTFGTMMAKGAVRDVARALGYPYSEGDRIARLIPLGSQGFPMTIKKAMGIEPELKKLYKTETDARKILDIAQKVEGCARHISVHAAGVVISPESLTEYVPLQFDPKRGKKITQFDMHAVEDAGLLKFDFLGIRNLSILADAVRLVKFFQNIDVDIENVPLEDKKTFAMLARGETMGLFQLNGGAMTQFLKELKPTKISDINAMIALYRPGPMKNIPEYIARKHGKKKVVYYHPKMKSFLEESYGILVYQEDVMFTALELAGYTWKTVDKLRKAIGKKIPEEMAKQHEIFVKGCFDFSGVPRKEAEKLWKLFEPFQGYGFNKAHAASYGKVAYQTAYMKANFPVEYMCAVLTADSGDVEKIAEIINECSRMKIPVLPPNINESFRDFTVIREKQKNPAIRFGLATIKNFGDGIAKSIIEERNKNGKFKDLADFLNRVSDKNLNKKSLEALIKCGALDEFGERGEMIGNIEGLLQYSKENRNQNGQQDSLFAGLSKGSMPTLKMATCQKADKNEKLLWEKELLGLYVSGHPLDEHSEKIERMKKNIKQIKENSQEGLQIIILGIIENVREIFTKKGDKMMFLKMADKSSSIEVVVFPRIYENYKTIIKTEECLYVAGKISGRNGEKSLIAEKMKKL